MYEQDILDFLERMTPQLLTRLPDGFGIYALWNHKLQIRYIGATPKATESFRIRVGNKHVTGSEGRSHKFSQAYCTGRMWRFCKRLHPSAAGRDQVLDHAKLAKRLRTAFIRRHCRWTFVDVPPNATSSQYFSYLQDLEKAVQRLAPPSMMAWEGIRFREEEEPSVLLDSLLSEMPDLAPAANSQGMLYARYKSGEFDGV